MEFNKEILGFIGGLLTTGGFVPQVWRLFKLRSAKEISLPFNLSFAVGVTFWMIYGIAFGSLSIILWNAITLALALCMLFAKIKWGR